MNIAAGVAKGLSYLHHEPNHRVIHGDLTPANILLGGNFHPKISDFGIPKTGRYSDLYCFGVLLVEIITGKKAKDRTRGHSGFIEEWLKRKLDKGKEVADRRLKRQFPRDKLQKALHLVLFCCRQSGSDQFRFVVRAMNHLTNAGPWPLEPPRKCLHFLVFLFCTACTNKLYVMVIDVTIPVEFFV
ncbi:leucine-rich repeat receptor-like protein kinase tdr [Phtheirospermum japonicum]|uniref:Leucine-rich repeat receptor-like protein kinase tdr n=1 Tax=Phtheirospermum japonicum TaxID=374723 RepID=A0A830D515_9LAMI|nr:leucine-rich repeat receptor-like protein kinase tdr [Phtheirospermum japonicum]